jgi:predicted MPP superfamily phosphohydrolase
MLKLRATGRGGAYTIWRGLTESTLRLVYARDWPARVWDRVPAATRVRRVEHELLAGRGGRTPLRLAFASDLHIGPLTPPRLLDEAFRALAAWRPDVLVLGGDYVFLDVTRAAAERLTSLVASVPATTKLAVLGNHDLCAHAPEGIPFVEGRGVDLLLCGHTHGGQVALPSGPVVVHGPVGRKYPTGLYDVGGLPVYVSRGLGNVDLPLRLYAPAEVALFTIA